MKQPLSVERDLDALVDRLVGEAAAMSFDQLLAIAPSGGWYRLGSPQTSASGGWQLSASAILVHFAPDQLVVVVKGVATRGLLRRLVRHRGFRRYLDGPTAALELEEAQALFE